MFDSLATFDLEMAAGSGVVVVDGVVMIDCGVSLPISLAASTTIEKGGGARKRAPW
jgi:hypothetical protein